MVRSATKLVHKQGQSIKELFAVVFIEMASKSGMNAGAIIIVRHVHKPGFFLAYTIRQLWQKEHFVCSLKANIARNITRQSHILRR